MHKVISLTAALASSVVLIGPATAQSWGGGIGMQFGPPVYVEPPVYGEPPVLYEEPAAMAQFSEAPIDVAPDGRPVFHMEAAEDVARALQRAGFRELSPMNMRGHFYELTAVEPGGDLVQLEVSIFTGEIERVMLLQAGYRPPPPPPAAVAVVAPPPPVQPPPAVTPPPTPPAVPAPPAGPSPAPLEDRLIPPPEEQDPLVIY
jgi:hypothetical protein